MAAANPGSGAFGILVEPELVPYAPFAGLEAFRRHPLPPFQRAWSGGNWLCPTRIPQALPGSRMASAGPDWQTSAATQITWGLRYIRGTYGPP